MLALASDLRVVAESASFRFLFTQAGLTGADLVAALEAEAQVQALMMMGEDHKAFYKAFKKKEKPEFKGI